jgi:oxygen tolerance protein BatD
VTNHPHRIAVFVALATLLALAPRAFAAEVRARVTRSTLTVGESTTLEVAVTGSIGGAEPDFDVPAGIEVLGSDKMQNYSWVNGRGVAEVVYRYELAPNAPGQYLLGPVQVRVGGQTYASGTLRLAVSAAPSVGGGGPTPVTLSADVAPRDPYVGQPVLVRIRMV